jgi:hypothetical protein
MRTNTAKKHTNTVIDLDRKTKKQHFLKSGKFWNSPIISYIYVYFAIFGSVLKNGFEFIINFEGLRDFRDQQQFATKVSYMELKMAQI